MAKTGETAGEIAHHGAGLAASGYIVHQRIAIAKASAVDGVDPRHRIEQGIGGAIDAEAARRPRRRCEEATVGRRVGHLAGETELQVARLERSIIQRQAASAGDGDRRIDRNGIGRRQGQGAAAVPGQRGIHRDIADIAPRAADRPGGQGDIGRSQCCRDRAGLDRAGGGGGAAQAAGIGPAVVRVGYDGDIIRIEQQVAGYPCRRRQVGEAPVVEPGFARDFSFAAVAAGSTALGAHQTLENRRALGPEDDIAALALDRGIGPDRGAGIDRQPLRLGEGPLPLPAAADPHHATALGARSIDLGAGKGDFLAGHRDRAAFGAAGIQGAGNLHPALPAFEHDGAALLGDPGRAHHARDIDHALHDAGGGIGRQHNSAAFDHACLFEAAAGPRHRQFDQPVTREIQCISIARGQAHPAGAGHDGAAVLHIRAGQGDDARLPRRDHPPVLHRGIAIAARQELQVGIARHEGFGVDPRSGGHDARRVDPTAAADQHTVGIQNHHPAAGRDMAVDQAGAALGNPVDRDGIGTRLIEADRRLVADVKALPVDHRPAGRLIDHHLACNRIADRRRARRHGAAGRNRQPILREGCRPREPHPTCQSGNQRMADRAQCRRRVETRCHAPAAAGGEKGIHQIARHGGYLAFFDTNRSRPTQEAQPYNPLLIFDFPL